MLTAEHVRVSRRKGGLAVMPRCGLADDVAAGLLDALIAVAREHHGRTRGELAAALDDVRLPEDGRTHERALRAAQKLVLDRCGFAARDDLDPPALRAAVFAAAAEARARAPASDDVTNERPGVPADSDARAPGGQPAATSGDDDDFDDFDRARVLAGVAAELGIDAATLEGALWADLEDAHVVDAGALAGLTGAALLPTWHEAELQALLLRARRVVVDVDASPAQLRALLRALKLHQLLFAVEPVDVDARDGGGWSGAARLVIEGPMALFSSSTRYGLKLALLLPHVLACHRHRLVADVAWKKHGAPEPFVVAGRGDARDDDDDGHDALPPLVSTLLHELTPLVAAALPGFSVRPAQEVVVVAGGGAFVPDLVVDHADGSRAFVEVLGFWSREAVWRRVAWAEQGVLPAPAVFCVSERLRVSEAALDDDAGGALVVFKGSLSAKKVAAALVARLAAPAAAAGG
jgi:predicted nuclease of restriction endonuclease-like RecB superfamily